MKSFLTTLFLSLSLAAWCGEKDRIGSTYEIVKTVKDAKVPPGKSVIQFQSWEGSSKTSQGKTIYYSIDGVTAEALLSSSGTFSTTVPEGKHIFQFFLTGDFYEIYTDSLKFIGGHRTEINLYFAIAEYRQMTEKPVIYLYPEKEQQLQVSVQPKGTMSFSYPPYNNGWTVTAQPDGTLQCNGSTYPYLFWDAQTSYYPALPEKGFVVKDSEVVSFLEEKLTAIGFNDREKADFITYWGPRLAAAGKTLVRFAWGTETDRFATLNFSPQPDRINRLYILWYTIDDNLLKVSEQLQPQILPVFDRSGFDVLEWGGCELPVIRTLATTTN